MNLGFLQKSCSRRQFLREAGIFALGLGSSAFLLELVSKKEAIAQAGEALSSREAMFYERINEQTVQCRLCPRGCTLMDGQRSFCRVRQPKGGRLHTLVYELPCAVHVDPIEKKPLFHMLPGSRAFSIATAGCNLRCKFCQNWQISQRRPEETNNVRLSCHQVVARAEETNCSSIAYTYTEPTVFYEYMVDTAKIAKEEGIKNLYHTGGFINPEPCGNLCQYLDAANVDLKGFDPHYLEEVCQERLDTVLEMLKILKQGGVWLEITNLLVPTLNDDLDKIAQMCSWINDNLGDEVPVHFSRFWPQYKLRNLSPTPVETLERAREVAISCGLRFVYIGNVPGHEGENTFCPQCKKVLIHRVGYSVLKNNLTALGRCKFCGRAIPGIWS